MRNTEPRKGTETIRDYVTNTQARHILRNTEPRKGTETIANPLPIRGFVSGIEKHRTPEGDGNISDTAKEAGIVIEKHRTPEGDGNCFKNWMHNKHRI